MATFWKDIKNKYSVRTYQDTKNTYDWIIKAINKGNFGCDEVDAEFLFDISSMLCSCLHSAAPNGSWCGDQRQLSAANGTLN